MLRVGSPALPRLLCPEVVGRDAELATAAQLALSVASGKAATLLVGGEPGIGKTALLTRAADTARREGLHVLRADCVRLEMRRPFGPFVDALSALARGSALVARALAVSARDEGTSTPDYDRYRAHTAMEHAIADLAAERPTALLIEDLHWADDASLELFSLLSRRITGRILLAATYRPEEVDARPALRRALRDVARERTWEIALTPLTASDVGRALRLMLGESTRVTASVRELLQARSGGNPLFLEEILRALVERGDISRDHDGWHISDLGSVPVPRTVREVVRERYRSLNPATRTLLSAAAVIGERFSYDVVAEATGLADPVMLDALRAAVDAQIITESTTANAFVFRHALTRDAIREGLLARERQALHLKVANALERHAGDVSAIAYHFDEAGDRARAHVAHVGAARAAAGIGAYVQALDHYERALELGPDDDAYVAALQLDIARAAFVLRSGERQRRAATDAARRYERAADQGGLARALYQLILSMRVLGSPRSERVAQLDRLFEVVHDLPDTTEAANAWILLALERRMYTVRDAPGAVDAGERAVEIARRAGSPYTVSVALHQLGLALMPADLDRAYSAMREALRLGEEYALPDRVVDALNGLQDIVFHRSGDTAEYREHMARRAALVDRYATGDATIERLELLWKSGRWDEYLTEYRDEMGDALTWAELGILWTFIRVAREGPDRCSLLDPFTERARAADINPTYPVTGLAALSYMLAERYGDALRTLEPAVPALQRAIDRQQVYAPPVMVAGMYAVITAVAADDPAARDRWLDIIERLRVTFGEKHALPVVRDTYAYAAIERSVMAGDLNGAADALARLIDAKATTTLRLKPWEPHITHFFRIRLIELLMRRSVSGDRALANAALADDVSFWRRAGAPWELERLRLRATEWGLRFPDEDALPKARTALTKREREVAGLLAQGLTNREIAERLTLSVRTAESHVEQIRSKLGFHTRAQIAAWAIEQFGPVRV